MRDNWRNLNGEWDFRYDRGSSGMERGFYRPDAKYDKKIIVPFCPQSKLSGIGDTDFVSAVWYRRRFDISEAELYGIVVLHFGAVDYKATLYINGEKVGIHKGGYVSFSFDITDHVKVGENTVVLCAEDNERDGMIPSGKQSNEYASYGCFYTRTTGIWQTVWLEFVPKTHVKYFRLTPDVPSCSVQISAKLCGKGRFTAVASFDGTEVGSASAASDGGTLSVSVPLSEKHLWEIGKGGLYDLTLTYGDDTVTTYFGLRSIDYTGKKFYLNGKSVFQRLVLDQGFYPDGIYTAPSDGELAADVDRSMAMGFNGARLHEKVFEERFLYHCDKKGYIVWGEYPNWGLDHTRPEAIYGIAAEWLDEIDRDFNHPSIIGWCPFNETWDQHGCRQHNPLIELMYRMTKAADPTRPCLDTSGNFHVITDVYDIHDYRTDPVKFAEHYADLGAGKIDNEVYEDENGFGRQHYDGKLPFFVSEYGGIRYGEAKEGWGYGKAAMTEDEFLTRLKALTDVLLDNPNIFGFCYTQLTDIEQEQNGLYTYGRQAKLPSEKIAPIFSRKAAIEE